MTEGNSKKQVKKHEVVEKKKEDSALMKIIKTVKKTIPISSTVTSNIIILSIEHFIDDNIGVFCPMSIISLNRDEIVLCLINLEDTFFLFQDTQIDGHLMIVFKESLDITSSKKSLLFQFQPGNHLYFLF